MEIYVVQQGDSVERISRVQNVRAEEIIYINQLVYPYTLAVGQALLIPAASWQENERPLAHILGYAYPFISPWVLSESLPDLTAIHVFSYGFTEDGQLVEPVLDDTWMIEASSSQGTRPVLTFTSIGPDGRFHSSLIQVLLESQSLQEKILWQLGAVMKDKGFQGLDIDFEYILPENRVQYADFVGKVRRRMNENGYRVSVAIAPKTSDGQKGLLVEGVDYALLGENADAVFLMTYEWGYTYGPPMAVAPLDKVRQVVEYALTRIPAEKLIMGIPNYGYDWPLPYERGITRARTIGNVEAVEIAADNGAAIEYAPVAQSPWFTYRQNGMEHVVWFEDPRSIEAKWGLVKEYGLSGAWYWNLMRPFRSNWLMTGDTAL